jgi:hypothetical protein
MKKRQPLCRKLCEVSVIVLQDYQKQHALKNTVMSLPDKFIVFLGRICSGHNHDDSMVKQEFPPEFDWFTDINVRGD